MATEVIEAEMNQAEARTKAAGMGLATKFKRRDGTTGWVGYRELVRRIAACQKHGQFALRANADTGTPGVVRYSNRLDKTGTALLRSLNQTAYWFSEEGHDEDGAEEGDEKDAPKVEVKVETKVKAPEAPKDRATALAEAVLALAGSAIDEAKVRALVAESLGDVEAKIASAVEAGLKSIPPKVIEIRKNGEVQRLEGKVYPAIFEPVLKAAETNKLNILVCGPAGSGKTHLAGMVAEAMKVTYFAFSCSGGATEGALIGRLLPTGAGGAFEWHDGLFTKAYRNGGLILLDDADRIDPNTACVLNAALANGHLFLPNGEVVHRHAKFAVIATTNTWGTGADKLYVGANQQDAAFLNRFDGARFEMDYDATVEEKLIPAELLAWGRKTREKIKTLGLRRILSTRTLLNLKAGLEGGVYEGLKGARDNYFCGWGKEERAKVDAV